MKRRSFLKIFSTGLATAVITPTTAFSELASQLDTKRRDITTSTDVKIQRIFVSEEFKVDVVDNILCCDKVGPYYKRGIIFKLNWTKLPPKKAVKDPWAIVLVTESSEITITTKSGFTMKHKPEFDAKGNTIPLMYNAFFSSGSFA